jgi:hypothetical protein
VQSLERTNLDQVEPADLTAFMLRYQTNRAILFFSGFSSAQLAASGLVNIHEGKSLQPAQLSALHNLVDDERKYPIVLVSEEAMMRGLDYRSDGKGLVLVIGKSFSTARDAEQGLARVGRFGDQSYRTILKRMELVDKYANARNFSAFYKFAENFC